MKINKNLYIVAPVAVLAFVSGIHSACLADDLEGIFEGKSETQASRNTSYLAETVHGLIGKTNPEQNFFLRHLEKSEWTEALLSWNAAFGGTDFEKSMNAKALRAYLVFQSGLPVSGLEELFTIAEPKSLHFHLLSLWREAAPENLPAWLYSRVNWQASWSELFGGNIEVRMKSADMSSASIEDLNGLAIRAPVGSRERAIIDWNLALAYAQKDQADKAAKIISALIKAKNNPISLDLMNITAARMLYQNGYFEASQKYYDKVPKKSDDYLEAQEEKAWSYLRRGEAQNALAITQTLVNPVLSGQVGPETWFLRSLAQLKACDFSGVASSLQAFPKEFKERTVALENLNKKGPTPELTNVLQKMKTTVLTRAEMVKESKFLPRQLTRDAKLKFLISSQVMLEKEADAAETLFSKSLSQANPQGQFDTLKKQLLERAQMAKAAVNSRALELASHEVTETKKILTKMHIVEAELVQRLESAQRLTKAPDVKKGSTGSRSLDTLRFPFEKEFWFDELTNYKVDIKKGCQARVSE